jgi:hypothetical protein
MHILSYFLPTNIVTVFIGWKNDSSRKQRLLIIGSKKNNFYFKDVTGSSIASKTGRTATVNVLGYG